MYVMQPTRRLASTWRGEYSLRCNLLRIWQRGKFQALSVSPHVGSPLDVVCVNHDRQTVLVGSMGGGMIGAGMLTVCDLRTGRVSKDVVHCSLDSDAVVTAMKLTVNKLFVGFADGSVHMISNIKDGGSFSTRKPFDSADRHLLKVTCIETITSANGFSEVVAISSSIDAIKIWSVADGQLLSTISLENVREEPVRLHVDPKNRTLVMATRLSIRSWSGVSFYDSDMTSLKEIAPIIMGPSSNDQLEVLFDSASALVIFARNDSVHLYDTHTGTHVATLKLDGPLKSESSLSRDIINSICFSVSPESLNLSSSNINVKSKRPCIVAAGCQSGNVVIWNCHHIFENVVDYKAHTFPTKHSVTTIFPQQILAAESHAIPIKSVDIDKFKIVSIASSGEIRIWDAISGALMRVFSIKQSATRERAFSASKIVFATSFHQIIVGIDNELKVWDLDPDRNLESFRKFAKRRRESLIGGKSKGSLPSPRIQLHEEARKAKIEGNEFLERERNDRQYREKLYNKHSMKDLTEEDMLQYAKMISLDERHERLSSQLFHSASVSSHHEHIPSSPPPSIDNVESFPPLAPNDEKTPSKPIRIRSASISSNSTNATPRKMSLSEFMMSGNESLPWSPTSPAGAGSSSFGMGRSIGATSSSYKASTSWSNANNPLAISQNHGDVFAEPGTNELDRSSNGQQHHIRRQGEDNNDPEEADAEHDDTGVDVIYKRRSSQYSNYQEWSSLQVLPHPDTVRSKKEEEELQWALELSLYEK